MPVNDTGENRNISLVPHTMPPGGKPSVWEQIPDGKENTIRTDRPSGLFTNTVEDHIAIHSSEVHADLGRDSVGFPTGSYVVRDSGVDSPPPRDTYSASNVNAIPTHQNIPTTYEVAQWKTAVVGPAIPGEAAEQETSFPWYDVQPPPPVGFGIPVNRSVCPECLLIDCPDARSGYDCPAFLGYQRAYSFGFQHRGGPVGFGAPSGRFNPWSDEALAGKYGYEHLEHSSNPRGWTFENTDGCRLYGLGLVHLAPMNPGNADGPRDEGLESVPVS
ncbi:hypothetical protein B0H10DRAFT_1941650 [Mycena sp. CBHHK59/15]|nr:hypothetical protein B0H10DRAFT_1941650 [Mycena sp. CBHHK59/15]